MGPRVLEGEPEAVVLYRLVRDRGELPYGGRGLARAGGGRRSRLLEPVRTPLASIQVAGETEGRARATARVATAAAGLSVARLVTIVSVGAGVVVRGVARLSGAAGRAGLLQRAGAGLERARRAAAERRPELSLALRRPRRGPRAR
jgi:hypothetical protein